MSPFLKPQTLQAGSRLFDLSIPIVMGIMNVTPDSFFEGSRVQNEEAVRERVQQIVQEGGAIVDIGACSTRPGSIQIDTQEEIKRLRRPLEILSKEFPELAISVDTYRADVVRMCAEEYGVQFINDISGGLEDPRMFSTVSELPVAYILMHLNKGIKDMHIVPSYPNGVEVAVTDFFVQQVDRLRQAGVQDIVLDPGYGFSKSLEDHYRLMVQQRRALDMLDLPVLVGISRKRMVQQVAQCTATEAMNGTSVLHSFFLFNGMAHIIRTHDVRAAVEAVRLSQKILETIKSIPQQSVIQRF